jgi:hypothetical protein
MKIVKAYDNNKLKEALVDRDNVINSILMEDNYDDEQKRKINKYLQLSQFQKDLLYLCSVMKIKDVCELYAVSHTHIYNNLKKIKGLLR